MKDIPEYLIKRQIFNGFPMVAGVKEEDFNSALKYEPTEEDLFVVSYPKSGTTWVQYIVCLIYNHGTPPEGPIMFGTTPFLEIIGSDGVKEYKKPTPIKSHLPVNLMPFNEKGKYIYVCRNPKDTLVSYFFHCKTEMITEYQEMTFDQFYQMFMDGTTDWGDYFQHILGWYEKRNEENILFITYEEMKTDLKLIVLRIGKFMGKIFEDQLKDEKLLNKIIEEASVSNMRKQINPSFKEMQEGKFYIPPKMKSILDIFHSLPSGLEGFAEFDFVRKGIIGDHKNHLSDEQQERMNRKAREKLSKCPDLLELWKDQL